jgi:alpha-amylase
VITQDDVLYMIVTDRFADGDPDNNGQVDRSSPEKRHGGDLLGIVRRMPYLRDLGVTALWITPVYLNPPNAYHGYHPLDFESVDPHLCSPELGTSGSREVLRQFVDIAHEHGLKVILDVIVCHTAPDHPWLRERPEWFNRNAPTAEKWWIWDLPDLNHDRLDVNLYFAGNVLDWMTATGVDGVRIDAARHIEAPFWSAFKLFAKGLRPQVTLVGEVWDTDAARVAPYQAYHGFDSMFDFPLYEAAVDVFLKDRGFGRIARPELCDDEPLGVLNRDGAYRNAYHLLTFLGNQDTTRLFHLAGGVGRPEEAMARAKLALTFLFTTRGIPQLYYGDELAMDGGPHPRNREDMPWSWLEGGSAATPEAARAREMFDFTRRLVRLRRSSPALRYGLLTTLYVTPTLYAFARSFPGDTRIVVLNNAPGPALVTIPLDANPRLASLARDSLAEGVVLVDELHPGNEVRVEAGALRACPSGRSGTVYRPM